MMVFEKEPIGLRINSPNQIDREISDSLAVSSRILHILSGFEAGASVILENIAGLKNMVQALLIKKPKLAENSILSQIYNISETDISISLINSLRLLIKNKELKKVLILKLPDTVSIICNKAS